MGAHLKRISMIPKRIHYCWFGGKEKPKSVKKCIESWKKNAKGYEIIEWNENNFNIHQNSYTEFCYQNKKWPFLSDFARLLIVSKEGGIYFDTDVELIGNLDKYLQYDAFYGFENNNAVATGLGFGAIKGHESLTLMIEEYNSLEVDEFGEFQLTPCPKLNTNALLKMGLKLTGEIQELKSKTLILPAEYMNPYDDPTGRLNKTSNTISIHWYSKSWLDSKTILKSKITRPFHRVFGEDCFAWLRRK